MHPVLGQDACVLPQCLSSAQRGLNCVCFAFILRCTFFSLHFHIYENQDVSFIITSYKWQHVKILHKIMVLLELDGVFN